MSWELIGRFIITSRSPYLSCSIFLSLWLALPILAYNINLLSVLNWSSMAMDLVRFNINQLWLFLKEYYLSLYVSGEPSCRENERHQLRYSSCAAIYVCYVYQYFVFTFSSYWFASFVPLSYMYINILGRQHQCID